MSPTPPRASTTPYRVLPRLSSRPRRLVGAAGLMAGLALGASLTATATTAEARTAKTASLAGVSITFGDQLKEYQSIFAATDALKGAQYTVNWANFVGGPPVIAAETGSSVDIGDMAETPTIFAQSAGDPVKVVAATEGINPKTSPYDIVVPNGSPIKTLAQLKGHTVAVQEGTVEQYFLVQALAKGNVPYSAVKLDNLAVTTASTAVTNGQVDAAVISQPLTGLDTATGKVHILASGAGLLQTYGYLTASTAALANPQKAAALLGLHRSLLQGDRGAGEGARRRCGHLRQDLRRPPGRGPTGSRFGPVQGRPDLAGHRQLPAERGQHVPEAGPHLVAPRRQGCLRPPVQQGGLERSRTPVVRRHAR